VNAKTRNLSSRPSERRGYGGAVTYLRVENPRFLFLGSSTDVVAAASVATASPPVVPVARAGASAARVASLVGCLAAGAPAPAPGAVSSAASAALGEGGEGSHLSGRARPPSPTRRRVLRGRRGGESQLLTQLKHLTPLFPVLPSPDPLLLLACRPLLLPRLRRARGLGAWAGRTARRSQSRAAGNKRKVRPRRRDAREWRGRGRKLYSPAGPQGA
jgi:hypothetical protein